MGPDPAQTKDPKDVAALARFWAIHQKIKMGIYVYPDPDPAHKDGIS